VLNTVMDLIRRGMHVYVVLDAISSQRKFDRTVAIEVRC
jgi:nicotinamidase-related amidase